MRGRLCSKQTCIITVIHYWPTTVNYWSHCSSCRSDSRKSSRIAIFANPTCIRRTSPLRYDTIRYCYTTTTTITTTNVHITVLPPQQLRGTLQSLNPKLLHSSTQTSADSLNGQRKSAVWLTKKVRLGLPSDWQKWGAGPSLWWPTVPCTRCSARKGAVAKGSLTSWRHLQCRGVSRAETAMISDVGRRQSDRYAGAVPCTQWYARTHNRNWIRSGTRSQWSSRSSGVVCSDVRCE